MTIVLLSGAFIAVVTCGLAVFVARPYALASMALLIAFAAQTDAGTALSLISRLPIVLLLVLTIKLSFDAGRSGTRGDRVGNNVRLPVLMIVGLTGATIATSLSPMVSIEAAAAITGLFYVGVAIPRFVPVSVLLDRIGKIAAMMVVGSLLLAPVLPTAFLSGRLAGMFRNPNGLGAAAVVACSAVSDKNLRRLGPPIVLATILSGSRSAGLGVLIVLLVRIPWTPTKVRAAFLVVPVLAAAATFVPSAPVETTGSSSAPQETGPAILRTKNNRSGQWAQGVADANASLPFGTGFGTAQFEYSNSALFLFVETGALAVPVASFTLVLAGKARSHSDRRVSALVLSMFVQSQFEGWMFAFGSFQATLFWLIVLAAATERSMASARCAISASVVARAGLAPTPERQAAPTSAVIS